MAQKWRYFLFARVYRRFQFHTTRDAEIWTCTYDLKVLQNGENSKTYYLSAFTKDMCFKSDGFQVAVQRNFIDLHAYLLIYSESNSLCIIKFIAWTFSSQCYCLCNFSFFKLKIDVCCGYFHKLKTHFGFLIADEYSRCYIIFAGLSWNDRLIVKLDMGYYSNTICWSS